MTLLNLKDLHNFKMFFLSFWITQYDRFSSFIYWSCENRESEYAERTNSDRKGVYCILKLDIKFPRLNRTSLSVMRWLKFIENIYILQKIILEYHIYYQNNVLFIFKTPYTHF